MRESSSLVGLGFDRRVGVDREGISASTTGKLGRVGVVFIVAATLEVRGRGKGGDMAGACEDPPVSYLLGELGRGSGSDLMALNAVTAG